MNTSFRKKSGGVTVAERLGELTRYSEIKRMAYQITMLQKEKRFRSLAVLSSFAAEGKTLFCAALAIAYAETCRSKVLVVDATTWQNANSLILKECFEMPSPLIDYLSLKESRQKFIHTESLSEGAPTENAILETNMLRSSDLVVRTTLESDQSLIQKVTRDDTQNYGLILLDTSALHAKNKNNIDPVLIAHLCDASVLVVSRRLLEAATLEDCAKTLRDPRLNLLGMISNEECPV